MTRFALSALVLLTLALPPAGASAVPLFTGATGTSGTIVGEVTFLGLVPGLPAGAVIAALPGLLPVPAYVASALFRVTMTGTGTLSAIGVLEFLNDDIEYAVAGWIPGATEPDGLVDGVPVAGSFNGAEFPTGVAPGQTSNTVFFAIDTRAPRRRVQLFGSAAGTVSAWMVLPEPSSATALLTGLALLARIRGGRRPRAAGRR